MSYYPGTDTEQRVAAAALETLAAKIFERCGMSPDDAHLVAHSLAWADLRGIHSHGVLRVPEYIEKLLAKGVDKVAQKMREIAKEHGIPVVENPPLARGLFAAVDVDQEVAPEFYKAVAEVISYVFKLKRRRL